MEKIHIVKSDWVNDFFPQMGPNFTTKLQTSNIALYSASNYKDAYFVAKLVEIYLHNLKQNNLAEITITDATACIGANTVAFAAQFKNINAIEINSVHCDILTNNLKVCKESNIVPYDAHIKIINNDYTKIYKNISQDVVFFDPPWGGTDYKNEKSLDLFLSNINIADIISDLLLDKLALIVILKAPFNYDIKKLKIKFHVDVYKLKKYQIFVLQLI